jgi:uncharacterized protein (UPF0548 family)
VVEQLDPETVSRLRLERFTYLPVGGAAHLDDAPAGHHWLRRSVAVGVTFDEAREVLMTWRLHERAGLRVAASSPRVQPDAVVLMKLRLGRFALPGVEIPCRVVRVIDEPDRAGFAYGTLPGHPESGEEEFLLIRTGDRVDFRITAFSRPATRLSRLGGPLTRRAQDFYTSRYLAGFDRPTDRGE